MDKETLSNYGWIVICVLVLAVMIALATPFGNFIKAGVENTATGLVETSNKGIDVAKLATGTPNNNGGNEPSVPIVRNGTIPQGGTYTVKATNTVLSAGDSFPETPANGDTYEEGDYIYRFPDSWDVSLNLNSTDKNKTAYGPILSEIAGKPVTTMYETFLDCTSLVIPPTIPDSVKYMQSTFTNCTSMTTAPAIPSDAKGFYCLFENCTSLKTYIGSIDSDGDFSNYKIPDVEEQNVDMRYMFRNCTSLTVAPTIPDSVMYMCGTFDGCTSLTSAPTIPSSVTDMSYTFSGCQSLTTASAIPDGVTEMGNTFTGCASLITSPTIPSSVTNMCGTFDGCTSLTTAPSIPSSVTNMSQTFMYCTSLVTAPTIPNRVTDMSQTFQNCTSLTGTITINANINTSNSNNYIGCFSRTVKPITLTGSSSALSILATTSSNGNVTTTSGSNPVTPDVPDTSIQISSTVTNAPASVTVSVSPEEGGYDYFLEYYSPTYARIIKFCPTISGEYVFAGDCDGDSYATILDEDMGGLTNDDDGNGNSDFKIIYDCTAGKTYYLAVGMYSRSASGTITVNISKN